MRQTLQTGQQTIIQDFDYWEGGGTQMVGGIQAARNANPPMGGPLYAATVLHIPPAGVHTIALALARVVH